MRIRLGFTPILLLFAASLAGAQPKLSESPLDRPPELLDSDTMLHFGGGPSAEGSLGLLSQQPALTGFAFGPGRDEVAYCAAAADGSSALWVVTTKLRTIPADARGAHQAPPSPEEVRASHLPETAPRLLWKAPAGHTLCAPLWSPNGEQILVQDVAAGRCSLVAVDYLAGKTITVAKTASAVSAAWSPEGRRVAYVSGSEVWLQTFPPGPPRRLGPGALDLHWSVDGQSLRWIAPKPAGPWSQFEWSRGAAQPALVAQLPARPEGTQWSPDGRLCAAVADGRLTVYPRLSPSGERIPLPGVHPKHLLGWSPDSRLVLVAGEQNLPVAVSVCQESNLRDDIVRLLSLGGATYSQLRSGKAGPPIDLTAGLPSWSSAGDRIAYVWSSPKTSTFESWQDSSALPEGQAREQFVYSDSLPTVTRALISVSVARQDVLADLQQKQAHLALRMRLLSNAKSIAMAFQMYLADYDAFPPVAGLHDVRKVMDPYLGGHNEVWLMPATEEVAVRYLIPPGLKLSAVEDPARTPIVVIDILPDYDLVGFVDGHAEAIPKAFADHWQSHIVSPPPE